jgi:hypothetical protein
MYSTPAAPTTFTTAKLAQPWSRMVTLSFWYAAGIVRPCPERVHAITFDAPHSSRYSKPGSKDRTYRLDSSG